MDINKQIIDEINNIIKSNYNNKEMTDKINDIIKLLITNFDTTSHLDKSSTSFSSSSSGKHSSDSTKLTNTNNSTNNPTNNPTIKSKNSNAPTINANNSNQPTININNTNQPTINITNTNQPTASNGSDSSSDSAETTDTESETDTSDTTESTTDTTKTLTECLQEITDNITRLNVLKTELCKLPLNPCEREYIDTNIIPIITVALNIANISIALTNSVNVLTTSPIVPRKKSKLKDTIDEIYDMHEETKRLYKVIRKRVNQLFDC